MNETVRGRGKNECASLFFWPKKVLSVKRRWRDLFKVCKGASTFGGVHGSRVSVMLGVVGEGKEAGGE